MKTFVILSMAGLLSLVALTACNDKDDAATTTTDTTSSTMTR